MGARPFANRNTLPGSIIIVDDESVVKNAMAKALHSAGVGDIRSFSDPHEAWLAIDAKPPEFLVVDWKMAELSGPQILQRCRATQALQEIPVLIVSGIASRKEYTLIEEHLLVGFCEKPIAASALARAVTGLWNEASWFRRERESIEDDVAGILADPDRNMAALLSKLSSSPRALPICLAAVRALMEVRALDQAQDLVEWTLSKTPDSAAAMTLLGKIFILRHDFVRAVEVLEGARLLFPENPERLCLLGDASLNMFDTEAASRYFGEARKYDPTWQRAEAGQILTENVGKWLSQSDLARAPSSFAAMLNAIGISLVRTGKFNDGVRHYETAMEYVSQAYEQARLAFNLGLGYARWQKNEEAADWFTRSAMLSRGRFEKPLRQLERLKAQGVQPPQRQEAKGAGDEIEEERFCGGKSRKQ